MYDYSGNWAFDVGVPAKSGVGGGIVGVVNRQLGIGSYSPRLDLKGNSVRGLAGFADIADDGSSRCRSFECRIGLRRFPDPLRHKPGRPTVHSSGRTLNCRRASSGPPPSGRRARAPVPSAPSSRPWGIRRSRPSSASTMASAMTRRANHLLSAGTTYHGASGAAGLADRVLVGVHVFVPELALGDVAHLELPALARLVEPREEALGAALPSRHAGRTSGSACRCARGGSRSRGCSSKRSSQMSLPTSVCGKLLLARGFPGARAPPALPRSASG